MLAFYNSKSDNFLMGFHVGESLKQFLTRKFYENFTHYLLFRPRYPTIARETSIEEIRVIHKCISSKRADSPLLLSGLKKKNFKSVILQHSI